mmetsp:Transcript_8812/g.31218  ORF Transcript_8812/g.31218 Transcript_8812/m.31218 type:complete len:94 (-) Transcript_8812:479-760(-)
MVPFRRSFIGWTVCPLHQAQERNNRHVPSPWMFQDVGVAQSQPSDLQLPVELLLFGLSRPATSLKQNIRWLHTRSYEKLNEAQPIDLSRSKAR